MLQRLRHHAARTAHQALRNMGGVPAVPPTVSAEFIAGAMLSVLTGWLEEDMKTPLGEMARLFYRRLVGPSLLRALALDGGSARA